MPNIALWRNYFLFLGSEPSDTISATTMSLNSTEWHPEQKGTVNSDQSYTLELPYSDERELIADILGFGPEVVVMEPASLKDKVFETVKSMINVYKK